MFSKSLRTFLLAICTFAAVSHSFADVTILNRPITVEYYRHDELNTRLNKIEVGANRTSVIVSSNTYTRRVTLQFASVTQAFNFFYAARNESLYPNFNLTLINWNGGTSDTHSTDSAQVSVFGNPNVMGSSVPMDFVDVIYPRDVARLRERLGN